jgi:hypothetical protein
VRPDADRNARLSALERVESTITSSATLAVLTLVAILVLAVAVL